MSVLVWSILTIIFRLVDFSSNAEPDLGPQSDCTDVGKITFFHYRLKSQLLANTEKSFTEALRTCQETEQLVSPRTCLVAVKKQTPLATTDMRHLSQLRTFVLKMFSQEQTPCLRGNTNTTTY